MGPIHYQGRYTQTIQDTGERREEGREEERGREERNENYI